MFKSFPNGKSFPSPTVNCRIDYLINLMYSKSGIIPVDILVDLCSQKRTVNSSCGVSSSGDSFVGDSLCSFCRSLVSVPIIVSSAFHLPYI